MKRLIRILLGGVGFIEAFLTLTAQRPALPRTFVNPAPADRDIFGEWMAPLRRDRMVIGAPDDDTGAIFASRVYLDHVPHERHIPADQLAEIRVGRPEKAIASLGGIDERDDMWETFVAVIQTQAHWKLGHVSEARKRLAEARYILAAHPVLRNPLAPYNWHFWPTLRYLIQETAASIPANETAPSREAT